MLFFFPGFGVTHFLLLVLATLWTYSIGYLLTTNRLFLSRYKKAKISLTFFSLFTVILFLAFFKYPFLKKALAQYQFFLNLKTTAFVPFVGISYFSFKMMHFLVDCYKQEVLSLNLVNYLNYILFFPSFISGPINRYNHFCRQFDSGASKSIKKDLSEGGERIIHGLFKKFVLVTLIYPYILSNIRKPIEQLSIFEIAYGLYAYAFYFYFDFSGYSDMAIGGARMMGIELPENFNNPFLKRNIQQLWANWHISLTRWLSDYIYWPIVRRLRNFDYFRKRHLLLSNLSILVTFTVCGMWHGETANFIVWGLYHGAGIACMNIYQSQKKKVKKKFLRQYFLSKYSRALGVVATFNFFVWGLLLFAFDLKSVVILILRFVHFLV
ncbi:MAG: MBOAT family O-acyltransferase [Candidatus Jordarchaeaceae archaeon]